MGNCYCYNFSSYNHRTLMLLPLRFRLGISMSLFLDLFANDGILFFVSLVHMWLKVISVCTQAAWSGLLYAWNGNEQPTSGNLIFDFIQCIRSQLLLRGAIFFKLCVFISPDAYFGFITFFSRLPWNSYSFTSEAQLNTENVAYFTVIFFFFWVWVLLNFFGNGFFCRDCFYSRLLFILNERAHMQ